MKKLLSLGATVLFIACLSVGLIYGYIKGSNISVENTCAIAVYEIMFMSVIISCLKSIKNR